MISKFIIAIMNAAHIVHISTAKAKRDFSQLVNQVFYGGQRVVVTSRGKPKVAIVNLKDIRAKVNSQSEVKKQKRLQALRELDQLHQEIVKETKGKLPDPVEALRKIRDEHDQQLLANLY